MDKAFSEVCIGIVDYGIGNIGSISNMLSFLRIPSMKLMSAKDFCRVDRFILPGIGAFDAAVSQLQKRDLWEAVREAALSDKPFLGICLGMQLLADGSEEGDLPGLGVIPGFVRRLRPKESSGLKVPHMGWADVHPVPHPLFAGFERPRFYFVHSYCYQCAKETDRVATAEYGKTITAACGRDSALGVQFHPEKSHAFVMKLFQNFAGLPYAKN